MQKTKTILVDGVKVKMVSRIVTGGYGVNTFINGEKFYHNFEIMSDYKITDDNHKEVNKEFLKRAEKRAYERWRKENKETERETA